MNRLQLSSPFLPFVPAVAAGDRGRVVFPGTTQAGRGLLSLADRLPTATPAVLVDGPSTYTRQPDRNSVRIGGLYPPIITSTPAPAGRRRGD